TKIGFENLVGIVEITDDQIEAGEVISQFRRQFRVTCEKSGQRSVFDRAHCLGVEPIFREHCNVFVPENLEVGLWPPTTKRFERGQSENEIADGAATDHKNAVHLCCVATALWAVFVYGVETVCLNRP